MNVVNLENINLDFISIQNPTINNNNYNFEINYNKNVFLLQTPKGIINFPQNMHFYNNYKYQKVSLLFENYKKNSNTNFFLEKINSIEEHIVNLSNKLWEKINIQNNDKKRFIKSIKFLENKAYLNLNIQVHENKAILSVFDRNKNLKNIDYIMPKSNTVNIIYLKDIWHNKNKLGTTWVLIQTKVYLPVLYIRECLISDDIYIHNNSNNSINNSNNIADISFNNNTIINSNNNLVKNNDKLNIDNNSVNDHPDKKNYKKFIKMHKFGVSKGAINIELQKLGLDYKIFLELIGDKNNKEEFIDYNFDSRPLLKIPKKKKKTENNPKKTPTVFRPPSQSQLKDMLSSLKKVKKNKKLN